MRQLRGLMKKDWTLIKSHVLLALLLDVTIPILVAFFYPMEVWQGILIFALTIMALHLLLPLVLLAILFTKEMDRPDIFFHSTASIHKINASKFFIAIAATVVSFTWAGVIALAALWMAPELSSLSELIPSGGFFSVVILVYAVGISIVFYFFMTIFFSIKPKIGGFAYIVTFGLFFVFLDLWSTFQETGIYKAVANFWVIDLSGLDTLSGFSTTYGNLVISTEQSATFPFGQLIVTMVLLSLLYLLSAYWFEKKVRV
ncbi:hypothetical protein [Planococcus salinus]|uniref:Uncharacterized protein n=1 Tax=Planococcus salinus TaxID=1848460 RepID=A0A3M8P710_9BACL|nr:hypothetical protein [Planococcus salinus]RNF39211.1 hypothetical protein EEX84_10965 [Planococcus salinus]